MLIFYRETFMSLCKKKLLVVTVLIGLKHLRFLILERFLISAGKLLTESE